MVFLRITLRNQTILSAVIQFFLLTSFLLQDLKFQPLLVSLFLVGHHLRAFLLMRELTMPLTPHLAVARGGMGGSEDIEFVDPATLAVGKVRLQGGLNNSGLDMRSNLPPQLYPYENEARFQLLMQRSLSSNQTGRYDVGDSFACHDGITSRRLDQSQVNNTSPFAQLSLQQQEIHTCDMSNGHWDGWNEVQGGNGLGVAELLRNERLGLNKFYSSYEDSKYRMPPSGDLYSRTFGM